MGELIDHVESLDTEGQRPSSRPVARKAEPGLEASEDIDDREPIRDGTTGNAARERVVTPRGQELPDLRGGELQCLAAR